MISSDLSTKNQVLEMSLYCSKGTMLFMNIPMFMILLHSITDDSTVETRSEIFGISAVSRYLLYCIAFACLVQGVMKND